MRSYVTDAIVLRRYDFAEADRIVVLYSKTYGKLSALAKGTRKLKSRLASACEPITYNRYSLSMGRNLDVITQSLPLNSFPTTRKNLTKIAHAMYCIELIDIFVGERTIDEGVFEHLLSVLYLIEGGCDCEKAVRYFEVKLIALLGYMPETNHCLSCGREFCTDDNIVFSPSSGSFFCRTCTKSADAVSFNAALLSYISGFLKIAPEKLVDTAFPDGARRDMHLFLRCHIEYILSKSLKTSEFIETLKRMETYQRLYSSTDI